MKSRHRAAKFQLKIKNLERIKSFNKNVSLVDERALRSAMLSEVEVMSLTELTDLRDVKTTGSSINSTPQGQRASNRRVCINTAKEEGLTGVFPTSEQPA